MIKQSTATPAPSPPSARVAAGLLWTVAAFWGLPAPWLIWWVLVHDRLPVLPFIGNPDGGPFYFHLPKVAFAVVLVMSFLLAFLQSYAAWLLWIGKRTGAVIQFGLLPVEALFWYGFALPIPPVFALVRIALIAKTWRNVT